MTQAGYALLGITAMTAMLVGVLTFALLRIIAGARDTKRHLGSNTGDALMLSAALQEAVNKLKAQEQAMSERADASDSLRGQIADSLTAGLLVVNGDGLVAVLNPAGQRLLDVPLEPLGAPYQQVLGVESPLVAVIAECLQTGEPIVRRSVAMPTGLATTHLGLTVSPFAGPANARGAICLFSDLTNVVELEEQLRLKETLARLGELTAGIAHEFRNGLATIHGYSRLIDPDALPTQYRPYVQGIRQEAEVLGQVVTNFLNFARPQQVSLAPVDPGRIARRAADDLQHELPAGTTIELTGEFAEINGDEVLLRQVFGNLLRNAAEACEAVGRTPAIVVDGNVDRTHRTCRVSVEDNGPGIPPAQREKVFRPFFTSRSRGTGLGLAIVQKIVLTHQGRVAIGTGRAGGAAVELTFRLAA
ncbi:MAG TPA: ATP-binding protein [Vicinamibacterales bacterium]|nr:ATP-binding protein [Vicinamibacterales bacterium]